MDPIEVDEANRRLALGLSMALAASGKARQDVATAAGISATHVTKLVSGQSNPSQPVLAEIARAVGYTVGQIYELGDAALEREKEKARRESVRKAAEERDVESLAEAAAHLGPQGIGDLIERLRLLKNELEEDRRAAQGG